MSDDKYNKMAAVFGADFEPEEEMMDGDLVIRTRDDIENELIAKTEDSTELTVLGNEFEDQKYIQHEFRVGIEMLGDVADNVRQDLKQGSSGSKIESFASIMKERREHINALKDVNIKVKEIKDAPDALDNPETPGVVNNNMILTSTDALDFIMQARDGLNPAQEVI
jgi:hypothetical protein